MSLLQRTLTRALSAGAATWRPSGGEMRSVFRSWRSDDLAWRALFRQKHSVASKSSYKRIISTIPRSAQSTFQTAQYMVLDAPFRQRWLHFTVLCATAMHFVYWLRNARDTRLLADEAVVYSRKWTYAACVLSGVLTLLVAFYNSRVVARLMVGGAGGERLRYATFNAIGFINRMREVPTRDVVTARPLFARRAKAGDGATRSATGGRASGEKPATGLKRLQLRGRRLGFFLQEVKGGDIDDELLQSLAKGGGAMLMHTVMLRNGRVS